MNKYEEALSLYPTDIDDAAVQQAVEKIVRDNFDTYNNVEVYKKLFNSIDLTTLRTEDNTATVSRFTQRVNAFEEEHGELPNVAAICVYPKYVAVAREIMQATGIRTAAVAGNFPTAQTFTEIKLAECRMAIAAGAQEIDTVISVGDLLEKDYEAVYNDLHAIREACQGVTLKVILETGELKDIETIFNASLIAAYAGADFIKTSTGKVPVNATPESVYVMCEALRQFQAQAGKTVGIKIAGGVTKAQTAIRYMTIVRHVLGENWLTPATFRIGASHLMDDIVKEIKALQMLNQET